MWDKQVEAFAPSYQVICYDVRGWGKSVSPPGTYSHYDDLYGLLKYLDIEQATILGISHGGKIAIDFTLVYPQMVKALVLVAPALGGYEFTDQASNQKDAAIEKAYERGDIALAIELEAQLWVDGPQRTPDQVSPEVRARALEMIDYTYHLPEDEGTPQSLDPPAISRLAKIKVPVQIIIGDYDVPDMLAVADLLATNVSGAEKVVMHEVAHLPCMEKPAEFNRLVLDFVVKAGKPVPNIQTVNHVEENNYVK
jgi:pimeloyl-ACP methyl ester carboxylesterase